MSIYAKRIVKKVKDDLSEDKKGRVTLYLNLRLYKEFQKAAKVNGLPASTIIEKLIEEFVSSQKKK